jgi:hypothetical protein
VLFAGPPFCAGYAHNAILRARAKWPARIGLAVAVLEVLALVALVVIGLVEGGR